MAAIEFSTHIELPTLTLRPVQDRDAAFFCKLIGDGQVRRFLGGPVPKARRRSQFQAYLTPPPHVGIWMVETRPEGGAMGVIVLNPHAEEPEYEISYQFHPKVWGKGIAREAAACVLRHALTQPTLNCVIAQTQRANIASCRLLTHLGMKERKRVQRFGAEQIIFATQPKPAAAEP